MEADADTVQNGATLPSVSLSQVMNGLGFFVYVLISRVLKSFGKRQ